MASWSAGTEQFDASCGRGEGLQEATWADGEGDGHTRNRNLHTWDFAPEIKARCMGNVAWFYVVRM